MSSPKRILGIKRKRLLPFTWLGSKFSRLEWLGPLLPQAKIFVDVCGGSGAVSINRDYNETKVYNDIDGEAVNFFRQLRDNRAKLIELLSLTPCSREDFLEGCYEVDPDMDPIERARRFFVRARQARMGRGQTPRGCWGNTTRANRGMAGLNSQWLSAIEDLPDIANRLLEIQLENLPAQKAVAKYDSADTLFYVDPPYILAEGVRDNHYAYPMHEEDHLELASLLLEVKGRVAVSGFWPHEMYDAIFLGSGWNSYRLQIQEKISQKERFECLWTNYKVDNVPEVTERIQ